MQIDATIQREHHHHISHTNQTKKTRANVRVSASIDVDLLAADRDARQHATIKVAARDDDLAVTVGRARRRRNSFDIRRKTGLSSFVVVAFASANETSFGHSFVQ